MKTVVSTKGRSTKHDQEIGRRIKTYRQLKNISQTKLAEEIGITFQQVQKYESGFNRVSASTLFKISKVIDVDLNTLVTDARHSKSEKSLVAELASDPQLVALISCWRAIKSDEIKGRFLTLLKNFNN